MKWAASEELLMAPFEKMAATSTSYSTLGARSRRVTLVVPEVFTVVYSGATAQSILYDVVPWKHITCCRHCWLNSVMTSYNNWPTSSRGRT